jgi:hypothetical protein
MRIVLDNGKYTYINDEHGQRALRYGWQWRDLTGDKFIHEMAMEIEDLRTTVENLQNILNKFSNPND